MFSHDESSPEYSACNIKKGDISNLGRNAYEQWSQNKIVLQYDDVYGNNPQPSVLIENIIKPTSIYRWFDKTSCNLFWNIQNLDLKNIDTQNCTDFVSAFKCSCTGIDISTWNTSNVTNMDNMFGGPENDGCNKLESLNLSNFNTSNVTNMNSMFYNCKKLTNINYGNSFIKKEECNVDYMFNNCPANKPSWW